MIDLVLGLLLFEIGSCVYLCWLCCNLGLVVISLVEVLLSVVVVVVVLCFFDVGW